MNETALPPPKPSPAAHLQIRWMIRRDMLEVLAIESFCFLEPWSEEDFYRCLRQRNCIGMVAEHDQRISGFMIYELHRDRLQVLNFAVHPACWRRRIGQGMANKLKEKLVGGRRKHIALEIRESNLHAQLFFRAMGFQATEILRDFYQNTNEDAYRFEFPAR